jgi:LPPG:FO 2-phospho-L-lactate transferase
MMIALAGGVGGAKLARGLAAILPAEQLLVVVNTGDDFDHLGLRICPDLDTVMYTLAGEANPELGWGLRDETWQFMQALEKVGGETWFRLGDRDLATHVERTRRLRDGATLSAVTRHLCRCHGVAHEIVPMSDADVRTFVHTREGVLAFQDYFVRRRCEPEVTAVEYRGAGSAMPADRFDQALAGAALEAIVVCPSNPLLSIGPILAVCGVRRRIEALRVPVIAVSPIIAGRAVKGPAAKMLRELGQEPSVLTVAATYAPLVTHMIIDERDAAHAPTLTSRGMTVHVTDTLMRDAADQARLARAAIDLTRTGIAHDGRQRGAV